MPNEKSKASILSAQLDFEDVSDRTVKSDDIDLSHLDFDFDPDLVSFESLAQSASETAFSEEAVIPPVAPVAATNVTSTASATSAVKPTSSASNLSRQARPGGAKKQHQKNDRFALYAAGVALCGFILIFASLFYFKVLGNDENAPAYLALPETVTNIEGKVIRIQVTLQVRYQDRDWLNSHKKALSDLFPIVIGKIDPEDLRTEQGFQKVQEQLRTELNNGMGSDKIQSVLMNELLTQSH